MRQIVSLTLLALALGLGGCAISSTSSPYGSFVQPAALDQQKLAIDAAQQLATLYAPARTRLELKQPTPDPFGQALVKSLREKGYAVLESATATVTAPDGMPLHYVLDQADDSNLYRLTLTVGNQSITRPYLAQNGTFTPAGYWARKE